MKKVVLVTLVILLSVGQLFAKHVDVNTASVKDMLEITCSR